MNKAYIAFIVSIAIVFSLIMIYGIEYPHWKPVVPQILPNEIPHDSFKYGNNATPING